MLKELACSSLGYGDCESLEDHHSVMEGDVDLCEKMKSRVERSAGMAKSRITYVFKREGKSVRFNVMTSRVTYVCMHESGADLSMLSDFDVFKERLDIVGRSFVTLRKALDYPMSSVHIRDTALLAPMGFGSLGALGSIYGEEKVELVGYSKEEMSKVLENDRGLFEKYAVQDSVITLRHVDAMENFYVGLSKMGVPLTLSSVGRQYVLKK